jgi:hypothetical protein
MLYLPLRPPFPLEGLLFVLSLFACFWLLCIGFYVGTLLDLWTSPSSYMVKVLFHSEGLLFLPLFQQHELLEPIFKLLPNFKAFQK